MEHVNKKGTTYYLHGKMVTLRGGGKQQQIYWFAKTRGGNVIEDLPEGFKVVESSRTGLPVLKRV